MATFIITLFIAILGFTFIIFIHELGHFLAARRVGIHVEVFSIGIGWRVAKLYTDSKGTDYILSLLPLGGYVKMKGQEDVPTAKKETNDTDSFTNKKPIERLFVVLAGVFMNFLSAFPLIFIAYFLGVPFFTNQVGSINSEFPISSTNLKTGESIVAINDNPVASYEDIITATVFTGTKEIIHLTVSDKQGVRRRVSTLAKQEEDIPFPQLGIRPYPSATIRGLQSDSPYYNSGLRNGMKIVGLEFNGIEYTTTPSIARIIENNPGENFNVSLLSSAGKKLRLQGLQVPLEEIAQPGFLLESKISVANKSAAYSAGIRNGDTITAINQSPILGYDNLLTAMERYRVDFFEKNVSGNIASQVSAESPGNSPLTLSVLRNNKTLDFMLTPLYSEASEAFFLGVFPQQGRQGGNKISFISQEMKQQIPGLRKNDILLRYETSAAGLKQVEVLRNNSSIGFSYADDSFPQKIVGLPLPMSSGEKIIRYPFGTALVKTLPLFFREIKETFLFVYKLLVGNVPIEAVGGPIAVVDAFQTFSKIKTPSYFLLLFAKISLSIAILNLLPIPVLDGGHAVFISYELLSRKPAPAALIRTLNLLGFVALIFLMIFVNYNDIARIINR